MTDEFLQLRLVKLDSNLELAQEFSDPDANYRSSVDRNVLRILTDIKRLKNLLTD